MRLSDLYLIYGTRVLKDKFALKGTVSAISSGPPCKDGMPDLQRYLRISCYQETRRISQNNHFSSQENHVIFHIFNQIMVLTTGYDVMSVVQMNNSSNEQ